MKLGRNGSPVIDVVMLADGYHEIQAFTDPEHPSGWAVRIIPQPSLTLVELVGEHRETRHQECLESLNS